MEIAKKYAVVERARVARHKRFLQGLTEGARIRAQKNADYWDKPPKRKVSK